MKTSIVEDASLAKNVGQEQPARYNKHLGNDNSVGLIADHCLSELLGFDAAPAVTTVLAEALMRPVNELTFNPGKRIRAQLVSFSYRLLAGDRPLSYAATKRHRSCAEASRASDHVAGIVSVLTLLVLAMVHRDDDREILVALSQLGVVARR